ncbi:hypothetical protein HNR46_000580 [Haloferula luteola]|uniref:Uncharacterized protein n=1 Tax=Haloferula luteola TaxID=595692 RepID=A0A840UZV0_9BACT|nr:hypothetical protein [Haloferula luteola]MBB5350356.1 hypothetical protein [Haloferula luteola]
MKPLCLLAATSSLAFSQVYVPPPADHSQADRTPQDTVVRRDSKPTSAPPLAGNELPFLDPSSELVSWNGHSWSATDNRLVSARFERYLNEPADDSEQAVEYRKTIAEILACISPHHEGGPDFSGGVALLPRASSYPGDAKLCDSLSQAIYAAVLAKKDVRATKALMEAMEQEKQRMIHNADVMAAKTRVNQTRETKGGNNETVTERVPKNGTGTDSLEYKDTVKRAAEIDALSKANRAKGELQIIQAKAQYQALMVQFFGQRRFEHVLMAARFYHQVFKDGDNELRIDKNSDLSKMLLETFGTSPTVAALDSLASEAIRDVDKGVEAFEFLSERGELESASKRLSEAYMVGEFMPTIQTLPREKKRKILEYVRESYKLIAAIDAKDYATAESLIDGLKETASDFDATKPTAAIATFTRVSNMHIDAAKHAAAQGDTDKAASEIQSAMEVWPQNPKLAEFDQLVSQSSGLTQIRNDFDRLISESNFREIHRRQYEIAPAIHGDATRESAFKQIIGNIFRIDGALAKASEFEKMDQSYAAWEQLATLREEFPDDPKLGRKLEQLAPNVADFTKALDQAQTFENRSDSQVGSALSWYLKARSIYPASSLAQSGIDRLTEQILPGATP